MTQPQDKMRAEFEDYYRKKNAIDEWEILGFNYCKDEYYDALMDAEWSAWQAACAQQSAQSSQDALNGVRYRFALIESPEWTYAVCKWDGNDWLPINDGEGQAELDAAIAAQGASNV